jgi:hypothetical protein
MNKVTVKKNKLSEEIKALDNQHEKEDGVFHKKYPMLYIIVGKRGSGKSSLLLNLLMNKEAGLNKSYDKIYLISPSASRDSKFDELVEELSDDGSFYDDFNNEIMKEVVEKIDNFNDNWKKKRKPLSLVIFDDCVSLLPTNKKKGQEFNKFVLNNRHKKCAIIILTQRLNEISSLVRSQADIISYYPSHNKKEDDIFTSTYGVEPEILKFCQDDDRCFITVSFLNSKPKIYKKFDELITE